MYKVIGKTRTRTHRVIWALEELGIAYKHIPVAPGSDAAKTYHPAGKIPLLIDGESVLTDSVAIMSYLSDKHGGLGYPAGTVERAKLDAMLHTLNEELDANLCLMARHTRLLPEELRVNDAIKTAAWEASRAIEKLEERLQGPWLMGEEFTIADILAAHCIGWAFGVGITPESAVVKDYSKRARSRDGFRKAGQR